MQFIIDVVLIFIYLIGFLLIVTWSWRFWKFYINQKFLNKRNDSFIMLEIKLPREINKSPLAMEVALASLLQGGGVGNWYARNINGNLPVTFSLEIASLEGTIHFYIRTESKFKDLIEGNLYAQYPGIEIVVADDYTKLIRYHHLSNDTKLWGLTAKTGKTWSPDPKDKDTKLKADFLPIKTYVDYGLEKDPKEEYKVDPITTLLEVMGGIKKGEYFWYQILVQDEGVYNGKKFDQLFVNEKTHEKFNLSDMSQARKNQIRKLKKIKKGDIAYDQQGNPVQRTIRGKDDKVELQPVTYGEDREMYLRDSELTTDEKDELEAINKKTGKPLAACLIRLIYITRAEAFKPNNIQNVLNALKPYAGANSFIPVPADGYDYAWQNFRGRRVPWRSEELFEGFVEREGIVPHVDEIDNNLQYYEDQWLWSYSMKTRKTLRILYDIIFRPFYHPIPKNFSVLNTEELASLWHLPGAVAGTPSLPRIDSTKGTAPVNLPQ